MLIVKARSTANFEHGPSMAAETARRLSCDCSIVPMIASEEGEPLNVGCKTRTIPPAIQRMQFFANMDDVRARGAEHPR